MVKALDEKDKSTGTSVPVLVIGTSGGAAQDIYEYVMGGDPSNISWEKPLDEDRPLPQKDDQMRDEVYVETAKRCLPQILALGEKTGANASRQVRLMSPHPRPSTFSALTLIPVPPSPSTTLTISA